VFGDVIGCDEGHDMVFQTIQVFVMERFYGRILNRPFHSFGLAIGPRVVGFGKTMLDAALTADTIKHVATKASSRTSAILGQIGEGDAVVGQDCVDLIREGGHYTPQEPWTRAGIGLSVEFDVGELRDAINGQEQMQFSIGETQLR
jgi:hypothetical protein